MLVQVKYSEQQKYVKLDCIEGRFDFMLFHLKVIERFCLPPDAKVSYKDATGTEVDAEIFSDLVGQGNVVLTVFSNDEFSDYSSISETSDSSSSSASTVILDEVANKRQRTEYTSALSAKQLVEDVLKFKSGGEAVLQEYQETETLTDATRRHMINILVSHMIDTHGQLPTKAIREQYAHGIVMLFPSLRDPYSKRGYVDQDFTLLFDAEISSRLLQKWDTFFRPNVIKEAKRLSSTAELSQLLLSAEGDLDEARIYDQEMASLLLLIHLLPPPPGGPKSPKISACDAVERLVIFHKSCCSLEEHLRNNQHQHPYLLAVGRQKSKIDSFYITLDKHLIPCQANRFLGAFDELFKAHFVFNLSYDSALVSFYTFLQTTLYNIDVGKMKESPRVKDLRARLLNQTVTLS
ncbi:uncharacterized protein LOC130083216 [Rhinichthys klamathensis goyatoka]|uniref:uncharacterized protein LOC130083216 n=1 Tax=Rhinichthys klamathensis goyatoka TaxID=3034132 RepID=UPI0024B61A01|nr:uncharacterized protein LOC130083216 [Rhinichthys klamathensis goyatoka]